LCRGVEQGEGLLADPIVHPIDRRYDIAPEAAWIVVVRVQGEPCERPLGALGPAGQQRCLTEARRGADQDKVAARRLLQTANQVGARQEIGVDSWNAYLCGQQDIALVVVLRR